WQVETHKHAQFPLFKSVMRRLWEERAAVWVQNPREEQDREARISALPIRSLLAVPLVWNDEVLGAIYLDTTEPDRRFGEEDLHLLAGLGAIVAPPLANALHLERLQAENRRLETELHGEYDMIGASAAMREVYAFVRKAAPTNSTVLIGGESGT